MTAPPKRLGLFALLMIGVGAMLLTVGGDEISKERTASIAGLIFFGFGVVLLAIAGGLDWYKRAFGHRAPETENTKPQPTPDAETKELTHTERALIEWLRMNDVPPDVTAQAIREILERRMGR
jgi:hypothetical protein